MALIALCADKGSPGVTTAALALAVTWPCPVAVAEVDPSGGDLALGLTDGRGQFELVEQPNLLTFAAAARPRAGGEPGVATLPDGFGGPAGAARLEALATWTESLRDTIAGAVGLEQAIPATAATAHPLIRPHLLRLVGRTEARQPLSVALRRLAADLADPSADLVVAALILNAELRGPGLRQTLTALAASAREEVEMRRRIEAGRRGIRRGVRIVVGVTVGFVGLLALFNREYLRAYDSPVGQGALLVVVGVFASGFLMLRRLAVVDMPDRFLMAGDGEPS